MRIISYNVNGIRAAIKKGFLDWLKTDPADVICLQETKAVKGDVDVKAINDLGYHDYWYSAQKKRIQRCGGIYQNKTRQRAIGHRA